MATFYGNNVCFVWQYGAGSLDMSTYQRAVTYSPSIQLDDKSSGSDNAKSYLTRQTDFTVTFKGLYQSGTAGIGSATEDYLAAGSIGTVYLWPQGSTVAGNRKYTLPAISQGIQQSWAYAGLCELNVSFQGNGTPVYGTI